MHNILLPTAVILLTTYAQITLRTRLQSPRFSTQSICIKNFIKLCTDQWIFSSLMAFVLSFFCWALALSYDSNATKAYPVVTSLSLFFISFLNFIFFQEKITFRNIMGGIFIIFGVFFLLLK